MIDEKQQQNVEFFNHLGNTIKCDARCTRKIKSSVAIAKLHSSRKFFSTANRIYISEKKN
jgi:hypothetical protein